MSITVLHTVGKLPEGYFLINCAVSGGTLADFLKKALRAAQGRLCVRIEPVYMEFSLPCPGGVGTVLTGKQAQSLSQGRKKCYSTALGTEYFCYLLNGQLRAVLMDTPETLERKLQIADAAGVPYALMETRAAPQA